MLQAARQLKQRSNYFNCALKPVGFFGFSDQVTCASFFPEAE
jgi:hypothetical protein